MKQRSNNVHLIMTDDAVCALDLCYVFLIKHNPPT